MVTEKDKSRSAPSGNASNPSPQQGPEPQTTKQVLDEKAEKYLREAGNIEDLPDAQEEAGREES